MIGVYTITNLRNRKIYVGYSKNVNNRLVRHKRQLSIGKHHNDHLQKAFNTYGLENFAFELLEECDEEQLPSLENYWCNMLNSHNTTYGYNIERTSPIPKTSLSEYSRQKISASLKGRPVTRKTNELSEEARRKISLSKIGKPNCRRGVKSTKSLEERQQIKISYDLLYNLYVIQNLSRLDVSKLLNVNLRTIKRRLSQFRIFKSKQYVSIRKHKTNSVIQSEVCTT